MTALDEDGEKRTNNSGGGCGDNGLNNGGDIVWPTQRWPWCGETVIDDGLSMVVVGYCLDDSVLETMSFVKVTLVALLRNLDVSSKSQEKGGLQPGETRKSSRTTKMHAKYNDYVVNSIVKYGLEEVVKYYILSTSIEVLSNDKGICLSQRKYCLELLHEFGLLATKLVSNPLPENFVSNHKECQDDKHMVVVRSGRIDRDGYGSEIEMKWDLRI
ncbi:hypothetical protein Tco_0869996, partial [Tanacetum coccineum]